MEVSKKAWMKLHGNHFVKGLIRSQKYLIKRTNMELKRFRKFVLCYLFTFHWLLKFLNDDIFKNSQVFNFFNQLISNIYYNCAKFSRIKYG